MHLRKNSYAKLLPCLLICIISIVLSLDYLNSRHNEAFPFDDSYISLKLATTILNPKGISSDDYTLSGATSPLHILLIAISCKVLHWFWSNAYIETTALIIGILFHAAACAVFYLLSYEVLKNQWLALGAGVAMAANGCLLFDSLNGLETSQYILLSLLTLYCLIKWGKRIFYAIPLGLTILTRPEGWFLFLAVCLFQIFEYIRDRDPHTLKQLSLAVAIVICSYCVFVFLLQPGAFPGINNTALSKMIFFGELLLPLKTKIILLSEGILQFARSIFPHFYLILPFCLLAYRLFPLYFIVFYMVFFYLFYFLLFPGAVAHYSCRYQHIFIPIILLAIFSGILSVVHIVQKKHDRSAIALLSIFFLFFTYEYSAAYQTQKKNYSGYTLLLKIPLDVATWIKLQTPPHAVIAAHDIGIISYLSNRKVLDLVGLINPEVRNYYWDAKKYRPFTLEERDVMAYLNKKKPDYLVVRSDWDRYFNFNRHIDGTILKRTHESNPYPFGGIRYLVYRCVWR